VRMSVPGPALLSVPAPEIAAASVSVSVKLATIWPLLTIAGVTIAPARPPVPRLSVLPAAIDVGLGELTTPPSAMVSVPTRLQPPTGSDVSAFRTEPAKNGRAADIPGRAGAGDQHRRDAKFRDERVDLGTALAVEHGAVGDRERARSEEPDDGDAARGDGRARTGNDYVAGDEDVGGLQRAAVRNGKRPDVDLNEAAGGG